MTPMTSIPVYIEQINYLIDTTLSMKDKYIRKIFQMLMYRF